MKPRRSGEGAVLAAAVLVWAAGAGAQIVRIDFGTADSPVRAGFVRVADQTLFRPGEAAGWVAPGDRTSADTPYDRAWEHSASRGTSSPPPLYTTEVSEDGVQGSGESVLRVAVPPGQYMVWALTGPAGGHWAQVWDVELGDGLGRETFAGPQEARTLTAGPLGVAAAGEGRGSWLDLRVSTRSRWALNALVVAPASDWPAERGGAVARIEQEVFGLPEDVLATWTETPREDPAPMPAFTEAERARGFAVFHRHYLEPVWPHAAPRREEMDPVLRAFASRDEYEPLTFTVWPLRDAARLELEVGDLRTPAGETIAASDLDVRYVRYLEVRPNYQTFGTFYRAPDVLMPWSPRPLVRGENLRVWITVHVDAAVRPGLYEGEVTVRSAGGPGEPGPEAVVPIALRVLPIALQQDRSLVFGEYYHHPYGPMLSAPDDFSRQWWRRKAELEHADMAAHGINTVVLGVGGRRRDDGTWVYDLDRLGLMIDLYHRHGMYQPIICGFPVDALYRHYMGGGMGSHLSLVKMPPPAFFEELTAMVGSIEAERRRRQWPELLYYPIDEPSTQDLAVRFMAEVLAAVKRVPGVRTYVTADPAEERFAPMRPHVDVWCSQPFSLPREAALADMAERGVEYWCYPNHVAGENDHTPAAGARMTYGFGLWRSGYRALTPWIYQYLVGNQWNYLDGGAMDFFNRTAADGSPIPVVLWEAYREGIDDGRYLTTLDGWIERAREAGRADLAADAEADRQFVWDAVEVQPRYRYDGMWEPASFDVYRWMLASQILKLQAAVAGP